MRQVRSFLALVVLTTVTAGAAAADTPSALLTARRLENAAASAAMAQRRLVGVIESEPSLYPPDPCRRQNSAVCRQVRALSAVSTDAQSLLAGAAALDHGVDTDALARRLFREATTIGWAGARVQTLTSDWLEAAEATGHATVPPSAWPPDPCRPAVLGAIDVLGASAESAALAAGRIDTCSEGSSTVRRLGHVFASLRAADARLDAIAINPPEPDAQADAALDAVIAKAQAILLKARAIKSGGSGLGWFETTE
jgi:hypothetical protein